MCKENTKTALFNPQQQSRKNPRNRLDNNHNATLICNVQRDQVKQSRQKFTIQMFATDPVVVYAHLFMVHILPLCQQTRSVITFIFVYARSNSSSLVYGSNLFHLITLLLLKLLFFSAIDII